ncbi:MAG: hypothetical protein ACTSWR_08285 [Candidatus Helarchaeota archaeon]
MPKFNFDTWYTKLRNDIKTKLDQKFNDFLNLTQKGASSLKTNITSLLFTQNMYIPDELEITNYIKHFTNYKYFLLDANVLQLAYHTLLKEIDDIHQESKTLSKKLYQKVNLSLSDSIIFETGIDQNLSDYNKYIIKSENIEYANIKQLDIFYIKDKPKFRILLDQFNPNLNTNILKKGYENGYWIETHIFNYYLNEYEFEIVLTLDAEYELNFLYLDFMMPFEIIDIYYRNYTNTNWKILGMYKYSPEFDTTYLAHIRGIFNTTTTIIFNPTKIYKLKFRVKLKNPEYNIIINSDSYYTILKDSYKYNFENIFKHDLETLSENVYNILNQELMSIDGSIFTIGAFGLEAGRRLYRDKIYKLVSAEYPCDMVPKEIELSGFPVKPDLTTLNFKIQFDTGFQYDIPITLRQRDRCTWKNGFDLISNGVRLYTIFNIDSNENIRIYKNGQLLSDPTYSVNNNQIDLVIDTSDYINDIYVVEYIIQDSKTLYIPSDHKKSKRELFDKKQQIILEYYPIPGTLSITVDGISASDYTDYFKEQQILPLFINNNYCYYVNGNEIIFNTDVSDKTIIIDYSYFAKSYKIICYAACNKKELAHNAPFFYNLKLEMRGL